MNKVVHADYTKVRLELGFRGIHQSLLGNVPIFGQRVEPGERILWTRQPTGNVRALLAGLPISFAMLIGFGNIELSPVRLSPGRQGGKVLLFSVRERESVWTFLSSGKADKWPGQTWRVENPESLLQLIESTRTASTVTAA